MLLHTESPRIFLCIYIWSILLFLPSCGPRYSSHTSSLKSINKMSYCQKNESCTVTVNQFSAAQVAKMFDGRGTCLSRTTHPIFPLEIIITNYYDHPLILDPTYMNMELVPCNLVAQRMHYQGYTRAITATGIGMVATAATALTAAYITLIGAALTIPGLINTGYATLAFSGILGISTPFLSYQQIHTSDQENSAITQDVIHSSLATIIRIEPCHTASFFIFAERNSYPKEITIPLYNENHEHCISLDVTLPKRRRI